jgi:GxxExxY protein
MISLFLATTLRRNENINDFIMNENEISEVILDCCFEIHRNLGAGLFESVYEEILAYELSEKNLRFERQKAIPLKYGKITFNVGFRIDFFVENKVILELKSVESILPIHKKQLLTYLKITNCKLGFVINFNSTLMKNGIIRIVNNL